MYDRVPFKLDLYGMVAADHFSDRHKTVSDAHVLAGQKMSVACETLADFRHHNVLYFDNRVPQRNITAKMHISRSVFADHRLRVVRRWFGTEQERAREANGLPLAPRV